MKKNFPSSPIDSKKLLGSPLSSMTASMEAELALYFEGKLKIFKTPLILEGTPFQKRVWEELQKIPFGETRSYKEIAIAIGKPTAFRAVAGACGANKFPVIIPCHRVINTGGKLGGYNGGLSRKEWLLRHEQQSSRSLLDAADSDS